MCWAREKPRFHKYFILACYAILENTNLEHHSRMDVISLNIHVEM